MLGHLVYNRGVDEPAHLRAPLLPFFVRRVIAALFRRH